MPEPVVYMCVSLFCEITEFPARKPPELSADTEGAFVWDQSGIRIIGMMQVSVRLAALPIPEYLDSHSGYSAPRSRIAGIYSRIYSYSRIFPNERALNYNYIG